MITVTPPILLASTSPSRQRLLANAGIAFEVATPPLDEDGVKQALQQGSEPVTPEDLAMILARAKADSVEAQHAGQLVIAADQVLSLDGKVYSKPASTSEARAQLIALRGKRHHLHSAIVCIIDGAVVFEHLETADLVMRDFSNEFIGHYLAWMGDEVTESVGGYKIEGLGIQLFSEISGDYQGILGLPLIALLDFLRSCGVAQT